MATPIPSSTVSQSDPSPDGAASANGGTPRVKVPVYLALWDLDEPKLEEWIGTVPVLHGSTEKKIEALVPSPVANQVWINLRAALQALVAKARPEEPSPDEDDEDNSDMPSKRVKLEDGSNAPRRSKKKKILYDIIDPFDLYLHTIRKNEEDDDDLGIDPVQEAAKELKPLTSGKLSQLTVSGLLNGLAGVQGGLVVSKQCKLQQGWTLETAIPSAANITVQQLKNLANAFHKAIQTRVEADVLVTTPIRIQEMLAPDLQPHEFKAIRKRIYDTVILGKGLGQPEELDIPTAASTGVHDIEKFKKCKSCGNNDQSLFVLDKKNGDVICSSCGTVASESLMHEGSQFRKFEGEIDRNHHGDAANPLYSNAHNMSTTLGGIQMTSGAGQGGFGTQKKGLETILRNAHAYTELNISQFGKGDRRTRIGYKDKQKRDAFIQMSHCGDALNLHEAVVQRAKELFAGFRDDRELVQQFKGVIAACLCEAFDQLSSVGKQILKQKQEDAPQQTFTNARANRRNELHHANLAGKGGLLLDFSGVSEEKEGGASAISQKPVPTWDLDDCRSWLMEASRSIAQQWVQDRKSGVAGIPAGSPEELEGKLVEHAITLNDALEAELKQQSAKRATMLGRAKVNTPRVNDMAKLGIKWQHAHERGSGGKGGVGGSGVRTAQNSGRTAGQILSLKTAKKLGLLLKDTFSGEAIHKELRALVNRQEAQKRKLQRDEATRQRFVQMKRKPWLQAKAEADVES
eukprot:Nitzschia sp. Nitz4//scaffold6_size259037//248415//250940//NITZ4_001128-RA/size259037-augustus-gene-0.330-mRNA-1//-1//CDS//3329557055//4202//frame0